MATLQEELCADYQEAIAGYEQTLEHDGKIYAIVRSNQPTDLELVDGGLNAGIGSVSKPGIDFTCCMPIAVVNGVRGLKTTAGVFVPGFPRILDLCNRGRNQIKNLGGDADPKAVTLTLYLGSPAR